MSGLSIAGLTIDGPVLLATGVAFIVALVGTRLLIEWLIRREIIDRPNERSSHETPTPRGGGIAVIAAIIAATISYGLTTEGLALSTAVALTAAAGLAAMSFVDDMWPLSAKSRLAGHIAAVLLGMGALFLEANAAGVLGDPVPQWLDILLTAFAWVWLVNLYNFMDGIDGISGVETGAIGLGFAGLAALNLAPAALLPLGLAMTAAAIGFLVWNWSPARIFLGDVGSVPLGYLAGFMVVSVASAEPIGSGPWVAAMILPAYYVADATITLCRRIARRENIFHAHRQHFYQQAVIRGRGHATVSGAVLLANIGLLASAWHLAPSDPSSAALAAAGIVAALIVWMRYWPADRTETVS